MLYEYHNFKDDELKIIHHIDRLDKGNFFITHLHQNIELLLMRSGCADVSVDGETVRVESDELVVIPSNSIHKVSPVSDRCEYYCLIVDYSIYEDWFKAEQINVPFKIKEKTVTDCYKKIFIALDEKQICYKQEVKAYIMLMLLRIFRCIDKLTIPKQSEADIHKIDMTRKAITYMHENFNRDISMDDIANNIGFSKYYFCRCFKEITGQTPLWHLNYIRLKNAKTLLKSGAENVTEAALKCGFNDTSYFCKLYKRYFNKLPKQDYRPKKS